MLGRLNMRVGTVLGRLNMRVGTVLGGLNMRVGTVLGGLNMRVGTVLGRLNMRVGIALTYGKHLHDRIMTLKSGYLAHATILTPPPFIEVLVSQQENEHSCVCMSVSSILYFYLVLCLVCPMLPVSLDCPFGFF